MKMESENGASNFADEMEGDGNLPSSLSPINLNEEEGVKGNYDEYKFADEIEQDENLGVTMNLREEDEFGVDYYEYMESLKTLNVNDFAPPNELLNTESPFQWLQNVASGGQMSASGGQMSKGSLQLKMKDYSNQGPSYSFEKFNLHLAYILENVLMKDIEKAKKCLIRFKEFVMKMADDETDHMYIRIGPAFEHVYSATEAYLQFFEDGVLAKENLKEILKMIKPVSEMTTEVLAGLEAIKGRFYLYCCKDKQLAFDHMIEATRLDPKFATWKYWTGKILRKMRRKNRENVLEDELSFFEDAVDLARDPKHLVFLAQAYREKSAFLYRARKKNPECLSPEEWDTLNNLNERSLDLYRECWSLNPDCPALCRRLGNGLMKLPYKFKDISLAKSVLDKALELSPNPVTFHILGTYYHRHEKNIEKAIEYYSKAAAGFRTFYGFEELIRLKYINDPNNYDPYEDLIIEEEFIKSSSINNVYCNLGWYFLNFKKDLLKALEYFWKVVEKDEDAICLTKFNSYIFCVADCFNIYSLLKHEMTRFEKEGGTTDVMFHKFLDIISKRPDLDNETTLESVQKKAKEHLDLNIKRTLKTQCINDIRLLEMRTNYDEIRKKQLKELQEHLLKQNAIMGPCNHYQEKKVVKTEENWRNETRSAKTDNEETKDDNRKKNCSNVVPKYWNTQKKTVVENWRAECKVPEQATPNCKTQNIVVKDGKGTKKQEKFQRQQK